LHLFDYFGKNNPRKNYYIENKESKVWLEKTKVEKESRKNSKQAAVSKANSARGWMRQLLKFFNIKLFKILYLAFVRAHLEFASAVRNSMSKKEYVKIGGYSEKGGKNGH
jgi:hypothetical protein